MTPEKVQKLWKIYCDEIINNGDKTSEDVRQAIATLIRKITYDWEEYIEEEHTYGTVAVKSDTLLHFANLLENMNDGV